DKAVLCGSRGAGVKGMIEINLLPEELRKVQKKKESIRVDIASLPMRKIITISIVSFVALQLLGIATLVLKNNTLKKLNKELSVLDEKYKEAQALKLGIRQFSSKLSAINELTSKSILWSKKMADLSAALTEGVWLSELILVDGKGSMKQQAMILKGNAVSYPKGEEAAVIANFINSLKTNKDFFEDFSDIKLESSQMKKVADSEVMEFTVICYFKIGRTYFDRPKK
ncbi:MAG: PilN domain-containing protein, partial [Candidatus Omnitrophica bacterium]|nr:PilN domain-containing protein [Candidatus Omnitrophota bacterium]